jgi:hypothetical protein
MKNGYSKIRSINLKWFYLLAVVLITIGNVNKVTAQDLTITGMVSPSGTMCGSFNYPVVITLKNNYGIAVDFSVTNVTLTVNITGASTQTFTLVLNSGSLGGYASQNYTVTNLADMTAGGTHTFNAHSSFTLDTNTGNDAMAAVNILVNPSPTSNYEVGPTFCPGIAVPAFTYTSNPPGATFTWTNSNPSIGLPANGSGNRAAFTAVNVDTLPAAANIIVQATLNGCPGPSQGYLMHINSTPDAMAMPSTQTICTGTNCSVSFFSKVPGTSFNWTSTSTGVSGNTSGVSTILVQPLAVTGTGPGSVNYTITPVATGCVGVPITATVNVLPNPTASNAGNNQSVCSSTATLAANTPTEGGGNWTLISGSGTVANPSSPNTNVNGLAIGPNVFQWSISNGVCSPSNSTVTIMRDDFPTMSNAGIDQTVCGNSAALAANTPAVGTGMWSVLVGSGTFTNPLSPTSGVTGLGNGNNVFEWGISNGSCLMSKDQVIITTASPVAQIGAGALTCLGTSTGFTDMSTTPTGSITNWLWDFGDGTTSTTTNPNHLYSSPGIFTVILTATSSNTCSANDTLMITIAAPPVLSIMSSNDVSCFGMANGSATFNATGTGPFIYSWTPNVSTTNSASGLSGATYNVTAVDINGCVATNSITINQPAPLAAIISPNSQTVCAGDSTTFFGAGNGGTPPYMFSWSNGVSTNINTFYPIATTVYPLTITDGKGCVSTNISDTAFVMPNTDIVGHVNYSGVTVVNGTAYIYKYEAVNTSFNSIQTSALDTYGDYHFTSIPHGNYLIKVFADATIYPTLIPTYFGNQFVWQSASIIDHNCGTNDTANITMIEITPGSNAGPGNLSGTIVQGINFFQGQNFSRQEGDPIPGVDVKLGKNPGGIIATTVTDANGHYQFDNVDTSCYVLYIDIPGLYNIDSSYTLCVNATSYNFNALDYVADSTTVHLINPATAINTMYLWDEDKFTIYPNPSKGNTTIAYTLALNAKVKLDVYNVLGTKVKTLVNANQQEGEYKYSLNNQNNELSQGVYFITLTVNGKAHTQRIIVME